MNVHLITSRPCTLLMIFRCIPHETWRPAICTHTCTFVLLPWIRMRTVRCARSKLPGNGMLLCNMPTLTYLRLTYLYTMDGRLYAPSPLRGSMGSCLDMKITPRQSVEPCTVVYVPNNTCVTQLYPII